MADAAETLRQAFAGLKVVELVPQPLVAGSHGWQALQAEGKAPLAAPVAVIRAPALLKETVQERSLEPFQAKVVSEAGWEHWSGQAEVVQMAPLEAGRATRLAVPPLPSTPATRGQVEVFTRPGVRRAGEAPWRPAQRRLEVALGTVLARPGLASFLTLPLPIQGESIHRLPKGLWMRYSLELVRATGENVRNLEVLGLFRLPRKGVTDLRHDPKTASILVRLEPAALKAPRAPFILARRKDDGALVSCFVEAS
jgi:hypothetical protein